MWCTEARAINAGAGMQLQWYREGRRMSYAEVLRAWADSGGFRDLFMERLRDAPYGALRWETPALSTLTLERDFECVLLESPCLDVPANPRDFSDYLRGDTDVADFANLGGDAHLIVPCPRHHAANYSHLAAFHRTAPLAQQHALWRAVASCVRQRLSEAPLWVNTAGGGVDWLHLRLDRRPKYYAYAPYREPPARDTSRR